MQSSSSSTNFFHHQQGAGHNQSQQQQNIQQRLQPSHQQSKELFQQLQVQQPVQLEVQQPPQDHHNSDHNNNHSNHFHLENTNQTYNQQLACSVPAVNLQLRNFKGEAYSENEKLRVLSLTKILGFLSISLSLTLLVGSLFYYFKLPSDMFILLSLDAIGILAISVLTVIWCKKYQAKILSTDKPEEDECSKQFVSNRLTQVVFNITCLLFIINILLAIHYCNGLRELKDLSTALNGTQITDFKELKLFLFIGVAILILILAILGFFLFAEFIVGIGLRDLTLTAHIFNFLLICLAIFIVFASKKSIQSQLNQGIIIGNPEQPQQSSPSNQYSTLGYCCVALAAINSIALLRKNRQEYFWIGTCMLFACCVISAFTREAHQAVDVIENKNSNSWQEELSAMNQNKVLQELKCQKYVVNSNQESTAKTAIYSTDCDPEQQILVWEDIQKLPINQRNYNLACLNENCKGQLKLQHSFWTRLLVFTMALTNESLFVVIIAFYQISLTISKKKSNIETRDIVFVVSSLLLSASTLLLISRQDFSQKSISSTII